MNNAARGDDVDLVSENGSSVHEFGQEMPRSSVNGESYAARTAGLREPPRRQALNNNHANVSQIGLGPPFSRPRDLRRLVQFLML